MNPEELFKALSNTVRLNMLSWLKEPELHFDEMEHLPEKEKGKGYVCVSAIHLKAGITQSTTSHFLTILKKNNLLISKRIGQWTYYRRNEETIQNLAKYIAKEL